MCDTRKMTISRVARLPSLLSFTRSSLRLVSARGAAPSSSRRGAHLRADTMLGIISPHGAEPVPSRVTGSVTVACILGCRLIKPGVLWALPPTRARRRNTLHVHAPTRVNAFTCVNMAALRRELPHAAQTRRPIRLSRRFSA